MTKKKEAPHIRLTKTDFARIDVAKRLRVFTRDAFTKECGISNTAAKGWIYRITGPPPRHRFLFPTKLADGRALYQFTRLGCRIFDLPLHFSKRLGPQARIERVAALDFVYGSDQSTRKLATPKLIQSRLNISDRHLARRFYFPGEETSTHVGVILVGTGSATDRIDSVLRFVEKALCYDKLVNYMQDPRRPLELAVLVRNNAHKKFIEKRLSAAILDEFAETFVKVLRTEVTQPPFTILVEVIPALCTLVSALETSRMQRRSR